MISLFISRIIIYYILKKYQIILILLIPGPFFIHSLIIILPSFNIKHEEYSKNIEIILVSLSYSVQYCVIVPLLTKIYGEKNGVFLSDFVIHFASASRWLLLFLEIKNTQRILFLVFMIIFLLFIDIKTFNFNIDSKRQNLGIELKERNKIENDDNQSKEILLMLKVMLSNITIIIFI